MKRTVNLKGKAILLLCFLLCSNSIFSDTSRGKKRAALRNYVANHYPYQLTDPQKQNRKSLSQFGYGLYLFQLPLYSISQFINPKDFGIHSYSKPSSKEKNGVLYTCKGGFIDFSHMRCAADWTVYLSFKILAGNTDLELPHEGGNLHIKLKKASELSIEDITSMAQRIAYERLTWHEVASWHYHPPNHTFHEQQSAFTPEDPYSNFLGTVIGKNIALRILRDREELSYSEIATEEITKIIASLNPLTTKKGSRQAYDIVDRYKQLKLPADKRNKDIWWDSGIIFMDSRYVFKRDVSTHSNIEPWLVPDSEQLGCSSSKPLVFSVPTQTKAGISFYDYYEFNIEPDSSLFYHKRTKEVLHPPFQSFSTKNMSEIINHVAKGMEKELLPGFNKRNSQDPVTSFKKVRRVIFK